MRRTWMLLLLLVTALSLAVSAPQASSNKDTSANAPVYTADGNLKFPTNYREWVYLSSGVDMSYSPNAMNMDHSMFDNVFANPEAYREFLETGRWPDKTMLVLEGRMAGTKGSINKNGHFQTGEVMGLEVHVKDGARFPAGKWAFFNSEDGVTGKLLPREMECYSCHEQHGAVDTTFVQFYPTLLEIAEKKNTLSAAYLKEETRK
jgi:Cytochrome P460